MNSPFELKTDFKNEWNRIDAFLVEFEICRHIWLNGRQGVYDKNKASNLYRNSLFSKRYIIINVIVMENYKLCLKTQFLSILIQTQCLTGLKCFAIWAFIFAVMASHLALLELRYVSLDFSGHGWFTKFSLASSKDMSLPNFV